jgi:hypothetical protein
MGVVACMTEVSRRGSWENRPDVPVSALARKWFGKILQLNHGHLKLALGFDRLV